MKIHFIHPFSLEKNYGKEINETFVMIPEQDWVAVMDWDCMLLAHEQIEKIYEYVKLFPDAGMFVARSNRSGSAAQRPNQLVKSFSNECDIIVHHYTSQSFVSLRNSVKELDHHISGYFMLISKKTWNEVRFSEEKSILGVDRDYAKRLIESGRKIYLMNNIYVWHSYRIWKNVKDTSHLL